MYFNKNLNSNIKLSRNVDISYSVKIKNLSLNWCDPPSEVKYYRGYKNITNNNNR